MMHGALVGFLWLAAGLGAQAPPAPGETNENRTTALEILSALPADTVAAITVRDLAECDRKLAKLMARMGLPVSPYSLLKGALEIVAGLDDTGWAAVALLSPQPGDPPSRRIVLLLPTVDRAALLSFLAPQPLEEGYTRVTLRGHETYAATKGRFTVFGPTLETVRHVVKGQGGLDRRLSASQLKRFAVNDVSVWANLASLKSGTFAEGKEPWLRRALSDKEETQRRWDCLQWGARVDEAGISLELSALRTEAGAANASRETTDSLLRGLPNEPFVLITGMANDEAGTQIASLVRLVFRVLTASVVIEPTRGDELRKAYETVSARITRAASSISLQPEGADGLLRMTKILHTRDGGQALLGDVQKILSLLRTVPFVDPRLNRVMERIEYRPSVETIADVTIDHLVVDLSGFEDINKEAVARILGPDGALARMGVVDGKTVVMSFGGGLARFNKLVAMVRAGEAPLALDAAIARSAGKVAGRRWFEVYLSVDRWVRLVSQMQTAMGMSPAWPEMPELNAPIALTVHSVGARETQVDVFIPTEAVLVVKDIMVSKLASRARPER